MTPLRIVRKLGRLIRGGAGTPQIVLGCTLGFLLGFTVGFNATTLVLILALLFLNANRFLAAGAILLGKILNLALASVTFHLGYLVIHRVGLEGLFRWMSETPVLALSGAEIYCQTGGMILGLVLGLACGIAISVVVQRMRRALLAGHDNQRFRAISDNKVTKALVWMLFGKSKENLAEALKKRYPLISRKGIVLAVLLVGVVVALETAFSGPFVGEAVEENMTRAVGAEVNVTGARLDLSDASLTIDGLQVTNPEQPTHNLVQARQLRGKISIRDLLARRLVVDSFVAKTVRTDQPRKRPGKVYPKPPKPRKMPKDLVFDYFQDPEKLREYTRYLREGENWLQRARRESAARRKGQGPPPPSIDDLLARARRFGYQALRADNTVARRPTVWVRKLVVEDIQRPGDTATYNVYAQNLTSHPGRIDGATGVTVDSDTAMQGELSLDFTQPTSTHRLRLIVPDIPLDHEVLGGRSSVEVENGTATVKVDGQFRAEELDLPVTIELRDLRARSAEGRSVLGMDPEQANRVLDSVPQWDFVIRLKGPLAAPKLTFDAERTLKSLIEAAGATFLKGNIDNLLRSPSPKDDRAQDEPDKPGLLDGLLN